MGVLIMGVVNKKFMNRNCLLLFLLLFSSAVAVQAQYNAGQSKVWAFGKHAGLDFTSGAPVPIQTAIAPYNSSELEGCASLSDANGHLLFYCTGNRVWDRSSNIMPNGSNILPPNVYTDATTQGTVITPMPGNANKYYIFSLQQSTSPLTKRQCQLYYSIVDLSLNNGLGDIAPGQSGILLDSNLSEAMTTVQGDFCDVWVLVHGLRNHVFRAYHITNMGISAPVLSNTGNFSGNNAYISGVMKCSPNRRRLVVCTNNAGGPMSMGAELCDFSPATGNVSNAITIDTSKGNYGIYGAAFSGDNTKLYLQTNSYSSVVNMVLQFDLSLPVTNIITSRYIVRLKNTLSDLKLGPDDKIYLKSDDSSRAMDCIGNPSQGGAACQYIRSAVILQPTTATSIGLPNEYAMVGPTDTIHVLKDTTICEVLPDKVVLHAPDRYNYFNWNDGSTSDTMEVNDTGTYWVLSKTYCDVRVDTFRIHSASVDTLRNKITADICTPNNTTLVAPTGYIAYSWNDGSVGPTQVITLPGTYWLSSVKDCSIRLDTFVMQTQVDLSFSLGNDTTICNSIILSVSLQDVSYRWQDGNRNSNYVVDHSGDYYVTVSKQGCSYTDTIHITYNNISQDLHDVMLCNDSPIELDLKANVPKGCSALWSDGSTGRSLHVNETGKYWVTISSGACRESDTVHVNSGYCDCIISLPNAFSPNGDGKNDVFRPLLQPGCVLSSFSLTVCNRWGDKVFRTENPGEGWDGLRRGKICDADTYMYILEYVGGIKGEKHVLKGDVMLVR